jgi:hypothetical protein
VISKKKVGLLCDACKQYIYSCAILIDLKIIDRPAVGLMPVSVVAKSFHRHYETMILQ